MAEPGTGARIGRYQLVAPIGAGGMGRVWVALDTGAPTLRLVALKTTLGGSDAVSHDFGAALADEAALAARIGHPNVCATHELGRDGAAHFLVMDWSDGASLRDVLNASPRQRIAPELAAFIASSVAAGLHAAHELTDEQDHLLGVVHRDVSPQNILISMQGQVRLADFGVAKARGQMHRPTETGEVKGKLSYMAPEQVTSKVIDRRADIFALGCVLYEAVLGVRPFHGSDALATMYKILEEDLTPPRALDPTFPEGLEAVVVKALAKDPSQRYQTAEEMGEALLEYLSTMRRPYADKHVAELLAGAFGANLKERNRMILIAAEQLLRGETDPTQIATPAPAPTQTLTPDGGVERSAVGTRDKPRPRRTIAVFTATAALATLLALGVWSMYGQRRVDKIEPVLATTSVPAVVPSPVASLAPEASPVPVVAATQERTPLPSSSLPPPRRGGSRSSTTPTPAASPSVVEFGTLPKVPPRKPRPIDRDNPFATQ